MTIEAKIAELVDKYNRETNKSQSEADVRAGYIDLLFGALGWNVYNDPGGTTSYRREGYIRGAGIADVGLEISGLPALMLEAKKFGAITRSDERLGDRTLEEKQLFRYARGKKIPYCILTNFERLHVFNADHERLIMSFDEPEELLTRLPDLLHLTPEKVQAGSLPSTERQLEIKPVDQEFLALLQDWRLSLANIIYQHNSDKPALKNGDGFDFGKLMSAVQRLLDRLILIRYADDKEVLREYDVIENIISYYHKRGAYATPDYLMRELIDFSHVMDDHHNTTLFQPGHICEQVFIPNDALEKIMAAINGISFRKFTSDILGNTYETYLSTKLVLKKGIITSEERSEIRKAGGIYYTPSFIVHYMVDNSLGCLLNELEKEHGLGAIEKVKAITIIDPACGSGSFLIYAYHVLADYYRRANEVIEAERVQAPGRRSRKRYVPAHGDVQAVAGAINRLSASHTGKATLRDRP
ncbi:MAG: N-6 DNA methylase [Chloroflexi bacterium]|nr:N-6 DNA methylase [Chloroflexota bacterium]